MLSPVSGGDRRYPVTTQDSMRDRPHSVVERLTHTFGDWLKHRRELKEMRQLNTSEFDRIAGDLRVSPADLNELVRLGPHAADELPKLLNALGIDGNDLARIEPLVLHEKERVCALCVYRIINTQADEPAEQQVKFQSLHQLPLRTNRIERLQQHRP